MKHHGFLQRGTVHNINRGLILVLWSSISQIERYWITLVNEDNLNGIKPQRLTSHRRTNFFSLWWLLNRTISRFSEGLTLETRHNYILQTQSLEKQLLGFAISKSLTSLQLLYDFKADKNRMTREDFQSHLPRCLRCAWCFKNETTKWKNHFSQTSELPLSKCFRYPDHLCFSLFPSLLWVNRKENENF